MIVVLVAVAAQLTAAQLTADDCTKLCNKHTVDPTDCAQYTTMIPRPRVWKACQFGAKHGAMEGCMQGCPGGSGRGGVIWGAAGGRTKGCNHFRTEKQFPRLHVEACNHGLKTAKAKSLVYIKGATVALKTNLAKKASDDKAKDANSVEKKAKADVAAKRKAKLANESLEKANERGNKHSGDARYEAASKSSAREAGDPAKALPPVEEGRSLMWWLSILALSGCAAVLMWRKRLAGVAKRSKGTQAPDDGFSDHEPPRSTLSSALRHNRRSSSVA